MTKSKQLCSWLREQLGKPYLWGWKGPKAYDCSGLSWDAYRQVGYCLPHGSANQSRIGRKIAVKNAHAGCLVFKTRSNGVVHHVGIVVENGEIIHAKGKAWGVVKETFNPKEWQLARKIDWLYQ